MPFFPHDAYERWVLTQIRGEARNETPGEWIRKHGAGWRNVFSGIVSANAVLELPALVVSRWEYLGSLYRGHVEETTGCLDAVAFARRFLEPLDANYRNVHNLAGRPNQQPNQSDIFMMVRNKPLHGANPAGVASADGTGVVGWRIGAADTGNTHLTVDSSGNLHINGTKLYEQLCEAMLLFAGYLDANTEQGGPDTLSTHRPQERWLRAAWARFRPHGIGAAAWMARGIPHSIPV
jgi:hypothetical protein